MGKYFFAIHFIIIFCAKVCIADKLNGELVFSHIIFRHGDRTPINPYPNDPWGDLSYWPTGWGQLTNKGKEQLFELGKWLQKRYNSILTDEYSKDVIYVHSTDTDRTKMSALAALAGLFPAQGQDVWHPDIKWQPIPIHSIPWYSDKILAGQFQCPAYNRARSDLMKSKKLRRLNKKFSTIYKYITKHAGKKVNSPTGVLNIRNNLLIEDLNNKTLPEWTKKIYPNSEVQAISAFSLSLATQTTTMARLKSGLMLKEIFERFEMKSSENLQPDRSLWIYSAHDTTIANILNTLKLFEHHCPPYTATVLMEMRIDKGIPLISIFYKNTTDEPKPMFIPECGIQCPLKTMIELYKNIIPIDWEEECYDTVKNKSLIVYKPLTYAEYKDVIIGIKILIVVFIAIMCTFAVFCCEMMKTERRRNDYISI